MKNSGRTQDLEDIRTHLISMTKSKKADRERTQKNPVLQDLLEFGILRVKDPLPGWDHECSPIGDALALNMVRKGGQGV